MVQSISVAVRRRCRIQIFFGREMLMLHKDPIEVGAVDAGVAGGVRNADRIGIIIFQVFFCFCKILQRGLGIRFRGCFLHEKKKEAEDVRRK